MDGWRNTTQEFERFVQVYGQRTRHSWIYALRNPLILEQWDNPKSKRRLWEGLKHIWISGTAAMQFQLPVEICDVLIYSSSNKPSVQPTMNWLAQRLGNTGVSTVHWGAETIECFNGQLPAPTLPVKGIRKALDSAFRYQALWDIPISLWHSISAYVTALVSCNSFARRFETSPQRLFSEIAINRHLTRVLREFLSHLRPKIIVTNGEQTPIGCALTAAARMEGIRVVWFFNEWPTFQMMPILSDELWVWNKTVATTLESIQSPNFPAPKIETIGMAQLDSFEQQVHQGSVVPTRLPGPRCLIFLSEHIPAYAQHNSEETEIALQWLAEAASVVKDWHFVIKPRPYHEATPIPGEHYLEGHKNIVVMRDGVTMNSLLASPDVHALAALSSSGLLLAAATGRKALRLLVGDNPYSLPPLDELVQGVRSSGMLVAALGEAATPKVVQAFPDRGKVLENMEALIYRYVK